MPNRSLEFSEACSSRGSSTSSSSSAPPSDALRKRRKRKQLAASSESPNVNDPDVDVWTLEATRITTSIKQLSTFLSSIRRAYLDLSHQHQSGSSLYKGKQNAENRDLDLSKGILEAWKDVRWLSDRERDEVDYQAKTMIRTCMARVKELETAEKSMFTSIYILENMLIILYALQTAMLGQCRRYPEFLRAVSQSTLACLQTYYLHPHSSQKSNSICTVSK